MSADPAARLAALQNHPGLAAALADLPATERRGGGGLARLAGLVAWVVLCLAGAVVLAFVLAPAALVPLVLAALGIYALVAKARADAAYDRAPLRALPVVVVAEETRIVESAGGARSRAQHVLWVEGPEGRYAQVLDDDLVGRVTVGDAGVAYVKGSRMTAFRPLPVA